MNLYRFEVETEQDGVLYVVVAASDEQTAFNIAEIEVEKYFIKLPELKSVTLLEKKAIRKAAGFVIES
ncbi:DUF3906 family protein [Bacillus solitudinis]|uniref:DUF3906 family protein n=1 Tax=Bacillus solitudinis TaxID=2014074 RepID=UPI000C24427D|nr:DUF3906 family protein [Bacillus solitudinis]